MSKRAAEEVIGESEKKPFTEEITNGNGTHAIADDAKAADAVAEQKASSKPSLYHELHMSSTRPLIVMHELGLFDRINVVKTPEEKRLSDAFRAINPLTTVCNTRPSLHHFHCLYI